jgi:hypothetical protein
MDSKFNGTWADAGGNHATIQGSDGTITIQFVNVSDRTSSFTGTEEDPGFHAPAIHVKFSDDGEDLTGALGEAGQKIHWSNNTIWSKVG